MTNHLLQSIMLQAMDSAREGITISDALLPDHPLIYVNKGFVALTGYSAEEIIGKNCRFLQGDLSNKESVTKIKEALSEQKPVQVELLNYHKNGKVFWNRLSITPVFSTEGQLTHFIGVQDNITAEKEKQQMEKKISEHNLKMKVSFKAQEKERSELGKELHDNINQMLATTNLYLGIAADQEEMRPSMIEQSKQLIQEAIQEIRKLSKSLVGPALKQATLKESVSSLIEGLQSVTSFSIGLQFDNINEEMLSENKKLMFYRIIQEQLNNTIKHAKAGNVTIRFWTNGGLVCLSIKDDGIGFDETAVRKGIGLQNIKNRIRVERGRMVINTAPGFGCEILAEVPFSVMQ